jgi:hypothetical protein
MNRGIDDTDQEMGRKFNAGDVEPARATPLTAQSCKLPIRDMKSEYNSYLPIVFVLDGRCSMRLEQSLLWSLLSLVFARAATRRDATGQLRAPASKLFG